MRRWSSPSELLAQFSISLFLSLSLHPVSTCLPHCWSSLFDFTAHPHPSSPFNIFKQQEGAEVPSWERSPLGVLPWSSGVRVAALGSDSTFSHPPNQAQSHPACPCFSFSSIFLKEKNNFEQRRSAATDEVPQLWVDSECQIKKLETWNTPPTSFILKLQICSGGNASVL